MERRTEFGCRVTSHEQEKKKEYYGEIMLHNRLQRYYKKCTYASKASNYFQKIID
jgi:hypothetical protein